MSESVQVRCSCGTVLSVQRADRLLKCPVCKQEFRNPAAEQNTVSPVVATPVAPPVQTGMLPGPPSQQVLPPASRPKKSSGFQVLAVIAILGAVGFAMLLLVAGGLYFFSIQREVVLDDSWDAAGAAAHDPWAQSPDSAMDVVPPKPLVTLADYSTPTAESIDEIDGKAKISQRIADMLKSQGQFEEAEELYQKAIEQQPGYAYAAYQLACNYELWGKPEDAKASFDRAVEWGFCDYPTASTDDELGQIRERADFPSILAAMKVKYEQVARQLVASPVLFESRPTRENLIVLLHGYGDTHEAYFESARAWTDLGFHAVAMPGSIPTIRGGYTWSTESIEVTHEQIQSLLNSPLVKGLGVKKVFLLGFSQGAMHSMQLAVTRPEEYAGVVAISPGGGPWVFGDDMQLSVKGNGRIYFASGSQEQLGPLIELWKANCAQQGWKARWKEHSGGHSFPSDWESERRNVASFLTR